MKRPILRATLLAWAALAGGCGGPGPVDPDAAVATLRAVLDGWKGGQAPDSLAAGGLGITAGDPRWQAGYALLDYQPAGPPTPAGYDLRCAVDLWLQAPKGKKTRERAEYTVTTHPARTVIRVAF